MSLKVEHKITTKNKTNKSFKLNRFRMYKQLYSLFAKNYFKSFGGPFFTFGLPLFFLILFYFTVGPLTKQAYNTDVKGHDIVGGYILLSSLTCGFNFLANRITEWKKSIFLKRLDTTPLTKWEFLFAIISFYFFICILGTIWMLLWAIIINPNQIHNWGLYTNFSYVVLGLFLNIIIAISFALLIGGISKSSSMTEGIVTLIYFPSIFLTGFVLPISLLSTSPDSQTVINAIGYFIPFKYSVTLFMHGWWYYHDPSMFKPIISGMPVNLKVDINTYGFSAWWQALLGALGYIAAFNIITPFVFQWKID